MTVGRLKMPVPKYYEMHKPFLEALKDGKPHTLKELKSTVASYFELTDHDLAEMLPSGRQTVFLNRIGWARTYLKKAGLIDSPARAVFVITSAGVSVLKENPMVIDTDFLMKFEDFRRFINLSASDPSGEGILGKVTSVSTPDDVFEESFKEINENLADEILSEVVKLSPTAFADGY